MRRLNLSVVIFMLLAVLCSAQQVLPALGAPSGGSSGGWIILDSARVHVWTCANASACDVTADTTGATGEVVMAGSYGSTNPVCTSSGNTFTEVGPYRSEEHTSELQSLRHLV